MRQKILYVFVFLFMTNCTCSNHPTSQEKRQNFDGGRQTDKFLNDKFLDTDPIDRKFLGESLFYESGNPEDTNVQICKEGTTRICNNFPKGCPPGNQHCKNGKWTSCVGKPIQSEICNNIDDDCDGRIDNPKCYTGPSSTMNVGLCSEGFYFCVKTTKIEACLGEVIPTSEVCDLQDNDCNGKIDENNVCGVLPILGNMIKIKAGYFIMGATNQLDIMSNPNEQPAIKVELSAFYIDRYEVTNKEYKECVQTKSCGHPIINVNTRINPKFPKDYYTNSRYDFFPVVGITWGAARGYCNWKGKMLPSEAQWERSAKGNTQIKTIPWPRFPWGGKVPSSCEHANIQRLSIVKSPSAKKYPSHSKCGLFPARVGAYSKDKTLNGIFDLSGNVAEWTRDCYGEWYGISQNYRNPINLTCERGGIYNPSLGRSVRGGSFLTYARDSRTTSRKRKPGNINSISIGFRCVKPVEK